MAIRVTLYSGTVDKAGEKPVTYYVDDKDALPPDIKGYHEDTYEEGLSLVTFLRECFKGERLYGFRYCIQIRELFYETPEE